VKENSPHNTHTHTYIHTYIHAFEGSISVEPNSIPPAVEVGRSSNPDKINTVASHLYMCTSMYMYICSSNGSLCSKVYIKQTGGNSFITFLFFSLSPHFCVRVSLYVSVFAFSLQWNAHYTPVLLIPTASSAPLYLLDSLTGTPTAYYSGTPRDEKKKDGCGVAEHVERKQRRVRR